MIPEKRLQFSVTLSEYQTQAGSEAQSLKVGLEPLVSQTAGVAAGFCTNQSPVIPDFACFSSSSWLQINWGLYLLERKPAATLALCG